MNNKIENKMKNPKDFDWSTIGLDFGNWEEEKIWALDLPVIEIDISELLWLFDAPFWENDNGDRYTITPWDVINENDTATKEIMAMNKADVTFPIDIFQNHGKWLVLDGLHRLAKVYKNGGTKIQARVVPRERLPEIASEYPIELPSI
jgi:hypothetical protein